MDKPDIQTDPVGWEKWWKRYRSKATVAHYYDNHKKLITWADDYIAPPPLHGVWVEIKMVRDKADPVLYHETWYFNAVVPKSVTQSFMHNMRSILDILCDVDYDHSTPYIIQIDGQGRCHLLMATVKGRVKTMDMILRNGKMEYVRSVPE